MKRNYFRTLLLLVALLAVVGYFYYDLIFPGEGTLVQFEKMDNSVVPAEQRKMNTIDDLDSSIVDIAEKTNPSVVTVFTAQKIRGTGRLLSLPFFNGSEKSGRELVRTGLGSGVITSSDGYILTNNHVVEQADEIYVRLFNNEETRAEVVGTDPQTDIAVLKINGENLPVIKFGNSDSLRVGEFVLAIGNPLSENLAHSVSFGIVSAMGRSNLNVIQAEAGVPTYENFIQTDAAINPGNSGGAMINMSGELVGINSAIATRSGGFQGIGLSIPINLARNVMQQLIDHGSVVRGYLGITVQNMSRNLARGLGIEKSQGVIVSGVHRDSPADEGGLQEGDVIIQLDGQPVQNIQRFSSLIASKSPGTRVKLSVNRAGEEMQVAVTLGRMPKNPQKLEEREQSSNEPTGLELGFDTATLTPRLAGKYGIDDTQNGVLVTDIKPKSQAYERGLRVGDLITSVNKEEIVTRSDFLSLVEAISRQEDTIMLMRVLRDGENRFVAIRLK